MGDFCIFAISRKFAYDKEHMMESYKINAHHILYFPLLLENDMPHADINHAN